MQPSVALIKPLQTIQSQAWPLLNGYSQRTAPTGSHVTLTDSMQPSLPLIKSVMISVHRRNHDLPLPVDLSPKFPPYPLINYYQINSGNLR